MVYSLSRTKKVYKSIKILILDGCEPGTTEYSQLLILERILDTLRLKGQSDGNQLEGDDLDEEQPLSEYFDCISGTGVGGVVAILAGSLNMRLSEIMDFYVQLHKNLFSRPQWTGSDMVSNGKVLHKILLKILSRHKAALLAQIVSGNPSCRAITCSVNPGNAAHPRLFSNRPLTMSTTKCTVLEAIELSLSDNIHLPPFLLGDTTIAEAFQGTAHRFQAPIWATVSELHKLLGSPQQIGCILSIGAGTSGVIETCNSPAVVQDCEWEVNEWSTRLSELDGFFQRFNVKQGFQSETRDLGTIRTHTWNYLVEEDGRIGALVLAFQGDQPMCEIGQLVSPIQVDVAQADGFSTDFSIPPCPAYLLARGAATNVIVQSVLRRESSAIMGPGGIGKTSVALSVLHHSALSKLHRYFIRCDNIPTLDLFYGEFAYSLGIHVKTDLETQLDHRQLWSTVLTRLSGQEAVVCLDSLETLWEHDDLRPTIEEMMLQLTSLEGVSVLATLRGTVPPGRVNWATPLDRYLQQLSPDDSFKVFQHHSKCSNADEYALKIVDSADGLPLALELLAYIARGEAETTEEIWNRWLKKGTSIASRGTHRSLDLNASIQLSLESPQLRKFPTAHSTLFLLSLLPAGLAERNPLFRTLRTRLPSFSDNLRGLVDQALVVVDVTPTRRFRLLGPISRYARDNLFSPLSTEDPECLVNCSIELITTHYPSTPTHYDLVLPELSNIYSVLAYASSQAMNDYIALGIVNHAHWAWYMGSFGDCMLDRVIGAATVSSSLLAQAYQWRGEIQIVQNQLPEAEQSLKKAVRLFQMDGNRPEEGCSHHRLGRLYTLRNQLDDAEEHFLQAIALSQSTENALDEGSALVGLGRLYTRRQQPINAERSLKNAVALAQKAQSSLSEGQAQRALGELYIRQSRFGEAEVALRKASKLAQLAHSSRNEGMAQGSLGELYRRQDKLEEAKGFLLEALRLSRQGHDSRNEGIIQRILGELYIRLDRLDTAETYLKASVKTTQEIQDVGGEGRAWQSLGMLYLRRDKLDDATSSFSRAFELAIRARNVANAGRAKEWLGKTYLRMNRLSDAETSFLDAIDRFQLAGRPNYEAWAHAYLGDAFKASFLEAIHLYQRATRPNSESWAQASWGNVMRILDKAETEYTSAISLHRQASDEQGAYRVGSLLQELQKTRSMILTPTPNSGTPIGRYSTLTIETDHDPTYTADGNAWTSAVEFMDEAPLAQLYRWSRLGEHAESTPSSDSDEHREPETSPTSEGNMDLATLLHRSSLSDRLSLD